VDRPNLFVKVPATPEGIPAVRRLLVNGVNVNITLMFALDNYDSVAEAYVSAMEERHRQGAPLDTVASVASMFVSRIDTKVDGWIDEMMEAETDSARREGIESLRGEFAIANARLCYQRYKKHFESDRFRELEEQGARRQRVLFASTSTKDPAYPDTYYPDTYYVEALIGPDTVVTMAPATEPAFRDHGKVALTLEDGVNRAEEAFRQAGELGIDLNQAMQELQDEGVDKFAESFDALMEAVEEKRRQLATTISR
jgi:transaldolase